FSSSSQEKSTFTTASLVGSVSTETFTCPPTQMQFCSLNQGPVRLRGPALHIPYFYYTEKKDTLESAKRENSLTDEERIAYKAPE
ncbi:MAG TPA: hypothetical protein VFN35_14000, partial [Ktedonobacteraceae bacterium]|nr:hypothetical protein [Ktedonobacteraceae bacterium]